MHFVFEVALPFKFKPVYQQTGPIKRLQWFCFSFAFVNMKYTEFLKRMIEVK